MAKEEKACYGKRVALRASTKAPILVRLIFVVFPLKACRFERFYLIRNTRMRTFGMGELESISK